MRRRYTMILLIASSIFIILWIAKMSPRYKIITEEHDIIKQIDPFRNEKPINLQDIEMEPKRDGSNIMIIETRCAITPNAYSDSGLMLSKRQACTIESAALANPNSTVYLLYTCSINGGIMASLPYVRQLFTYSNIKIMKVDIPSFLQDTPLKDWNYKEIVGKSKWPVEHGSDVLRFVSLYKYGGFYIDHDMIIRKPVNVLGKNFLVKEDDNTLAASVLNFGTDEFGHKMSEQCVEEIRNNFDGSNWGHNGPALVTRTMIKICNVEKVSNMTEKDCKGFKIYPRGEFFPIPYGSWGSLFTSQNIAEEMKKYTNCSGVHAWNFVSKEQNLNLHIVTPYGLLASMHCPRVHSYSEINF